MRKPTIVYDRINNLVWVLGQKRAGKADKSVKFFGKDAEKFRTQAAAKKYASQLARRYKGEVYDKLERKTYSPRKPVKRRVVVRRRDPWGFNW